MDVKYVLENFEIVCCDAVRSAILATAWLLVLETIQSAAYIRHEFQNGKLLLQVCARHYTVCGVTVRASSSRHVNQTHIHRHAGALRVTYTRPCRHRIVMYKHAQRMFSLNCLLFITLFNVIFTAKRNEVGHTSLWASDI